MDEVSELEAAQLASAFRPNRKPMIVAVLANVVLALLLLGVPYWRGQKLAATSRLRFAELGRCLMGGDIAPQPGLSLPQGDRDHFAAKVLLARPDWPLSCRPALQRLGPEPAVFLWPSVKQAGADLRGAVELLDRELVALDRRRKAGLRRVPERPLTALRTVQAATVLFARAGGAELDLDNDALRWNTAPQLAMPARLPLMASADANLDLYSDGTSLEALALDGRGLSYLRVADGKIDRERVRRTSFVRAVVRAGADARLVWAMPDARCNEREDHCAGRPLGLTPYDQGAAALQEPAWKLAGHPAGRIDRVLHITPSGRVSLLARATAGGALELLRFDLPASPTKLETPAFGTVGTQAPPPFAPSDHWPVRGDGDPAEATLISGSEPAAVLYAEQQPDAVRATLVWADAQRLPLQLPAATGQGPWALGCANAGANVLAYGSSSALHLMRSEPGAAPVALLAQPEKLVRPLHVDDPALDQVRLLCDANRTQLFWINAARELWIAGCTNTLCAAPKLLATQTGSFAALFNRTGTVLALGGPADEIRVLRLDDQAQPREPAYAPAACFEPTSGMCGTPGLVADAQRLVLTARDRSDLLALESTDGGASFTTLAGVVGAAKIEQSTTSPLKQHRLRKGLD